MSIPAVELIRAEVRRFWLPSCTLAAATVWLSTRNASGAITVSVHYGALAAALGMPLFWLAARSPKRALVLSTGLAGAILVLVIYCWNETYIERWEDVNKTRYEDRRRRWGGAIEYRRLKRAVGDELAWEEGPVVSGQPHGQWKRREQRPPSEEPVWYWRGKRVTEAEWKRREGGT